jgi:CHASE3 domain sensor protein
MSSNPSHQEKTPRRRLFADLRIGAKLAIGFGVLVVFFFLSAVISFNSSAEAARQIEKTETVRVPTALLASKAQTDLLRMLADVRGYLFLGAPEYRNLYYESSQNFEGDLSELKGKSSDDLGTVGSARLDELEVLYGDWDVLPDQLFELRDDQLDREPAYEKLATDGVLYAGNVIVSMNQMIDQQGQREATDRNLALMSDMANFQGNFSAMLSALRGYVTTRNRIYRGEFEVNLVDNNNAWKRLTDNREQLTTAQQELLDKIGENREKFLAMPDEIFMILESDDLWRKDLFLFTNEAVPVTDQMSASLDELVKDQQQSLQDDLEAGRQALQTANRLILITGVIALVFAFAMWYLSRQTIALPISRLTRVAEQIRGGDLEAQASVEARDEIGILAATFNSMTAKLRDTLFQVRKEKKRADDLLEVVIPIGVELSTEKDFNRLLEKMLLEAKSFCRADSGILYMITPQGGELEFVIVRSDSLSLALGGKTGAKPQYAPLPLKDTAGESNGSSIVARVALSGETANLVDAEQLGENALWGDNAQNETLRAYSVKSLLAIPLKNSEGKTLGVLELINAQDVDTSEIIVFDVNLQQMMESFSSLAVAALEAFAREQKLKSEIQQLRIEIDQSKRQKQVSEIVESDFFKDLSTRARQMRTRQTGGKKEE